MELICEKFVFTIDNKSNEKSWFPTECQCQHYKIFMQQQNNITHHFKIAIMNDTITLQKQFRYNKLLLELVFSQQKHNRHFKLKLWFKATWDQDLLLHIFVTFRSVCTQTDYLLIIKVLLKLRLLLEDLLVTIHPYFTSITIVVTITNVLNKKTSTLP